MQDILTAAEPNDTVQTVIDDLIRDNITVKIKTTTTEKPKSAVEIYLELLQSMIKPTHEEQVLLEEDSQDDEYQDYYYQEFLSNQAVLNNFSEEDLLIGDSFESEGNVNLMLETEAEQIVPDPTTTTTERFNSAFPELYRDLTIFEKISSHERKEETVMRNLRNKFVEKRVRKRIKHKSQEEQKEDEGGESTTTTTTETTTEESSPTETPSILFLESFKPRFVVENADLEKDLLITTSSGSLYGKRSSSSTGQGQCLK